MRPRVICHMLSSVDGKIDGASLRAVTGEGEYEATGAKLNGDAWVCGRTTMQQHFAEDEPFVSTSNAPAGPQPTFVARRAKSYAISVDTHGKLRWESGDLHGDHLICVVSERPLPTTSRCCGRRASPTSSPAQPKVDLGRRPEPAWRALRHPHAAARRRRQHQWRRSSKPIWWTK